LTSSPPSALSGRRLRGNGRDSFCKTATSRRENVASRVTVTIMGRPTSPTAPFPHSKTLPALWSGAAVTHAAGLGRVGFIDLLEPYPRVIAFVPEHGPQRAPTGIEHRLSVSASSQRGNVDIADKDGCISCPRQPGCALMQVVPPAIGNSGVDGAHAIDSAGALRASEGRLEVAIEPRPFNVLERRVRKGGQLLDPQVDAERLCGARGAHTRLHRAGYLHCHVQIPPAAGVLREAPAAQCVRRKAVAVPKREPSALEEYLPVLVPSGAGFERDPSEGAAGTATHAPAQLRFTVLRASCHILLGDLLAHDRPDTHSRAACPLEVSLQFVGTDEAVLAPQHLHRQIVAVVPDQIGRARHLRQHLPVLVLDSQPQHANGSPATFHTVQIYSISARAATSPRSHSLDLEQGVLPGQKPGASALKLE
jgi:hypothetical protein